MAHKTAPNSEDRLIEVESLVCFFGSWPVNKGISFVLRGGQLGLITGGNGSGKTTILRALLGEVRYRAETLRVLGKRPPPGRPWELTQREVRVIPQFTVLPLFLTVREYLSAWAASTPARLLEKGQRAGDAWNVESRICETIGIERNTLIRELSFGQRRMLDTLLALEARPKVVLADEPLAGVSAALIPTIAEAVRGYLAVSGAVLMAVHRPEMQHWTPNWVTEVVTSRCNG